MKPKYKGSLLFFQYLGKLFYAFSAIDKSVNDSEILSLKEKIKQQWLYEHDDDLFEILRAFNDMYAQRMDAQSCFEEFVAFKRDHSYLFTDNVKYLILNTVTAIANSFAGLNKSELILLAKLEIEFKT